MTSQASQIVEKEFLSPVIFDDSSSTEGEETKSDHFTAGKKYAFASLLKAISLHALVLLLYSLIFAWAWQNSRKSCLPQENVVFTPYQGQYEGRVFEHAHSVYVGSPSSELDTAWKKLLQNVNFRITEYEMSQIPGRKEDEIPLPDGGFTVLSMSTTTYTKRLHHYMYKDLYFPNVTQEQNDALEYHNHHCLDMLRQSITCQGDTQILTMKWRADHRVPTANFTMPHKCVNWKGLEEWADSRRIKKLMEPGYFVHPTLGPAYPERKGDKIGEFDTGHE